MGGWVEREKKKKEKESEGEGEGAGLYRLRSTTKEWSAQTLFRKRRRRVEIKHSLLCGADN